MQFAYFSWSATNVFSALRSQSQESARLAHPGHPTFSPAPSREAKNGVYLAIQFPSRQGHSLCKKSQWFWICPSWKSLGKVADQAWPEVWPGPVRLFIPIITWQTCLGQHYLRRKMIHAIQVAVLLFVIVTIQWTEPIIKSQKGFLHLLPSATCYFKTCFRSSQETWLRAAKACDPRRGRRCSARCPIP